MSEFEKFEIEEEEAANESQTVSAREASVLEDEIWVFVEEFLRHYKRDANQPIECVPSGRALLSNNPADLAQILVIAFKVTPRVMKQTGYDVLSSLRKLLLEKKLPLTSAEVDSLCEELQSEVKKNGAINKAILASIEASAKSRPLTDKARRLLRNVRETGVDSLKAGKQGPLRTRIKALIRETVIRMPVIDDGTEWSRGIIAMVDAMGPEEKNCWLELLAHCVLATASQPSTNWRNSAAPLVKKAGLEKLHAMLASWPKLLVNIHVVVVDLDFWMRAHSDYAANQTIMKGLVWCTAIEPNQQTPGLLRDIAIAAFKAMPRLGPRGKLGNACIQVLGEIGSTESVAQIAALKSRLKNGTTQRVIARQFEKIAQRLGVSETEMEELTIPTFGMTEVGRRTYSLGDFSAQLVVASAGSQLNWHRSDGKPQKSLPIDIKKNHSEELKQLKATIKDIDNILVAQGSRIESLFCHPRGWNLATWKDRYLNHPVVGVIARNLVWQFIDGGQESTAIWHQGQLVDCKNTALNPSELATVRLWHPLEDEIDHVMSWRDWIVQNQIRQPFKQAHREIYLLTDAERQTATYSNRFAAHFLRQSQFRTLAKMRGWKADFMGGFDGGDMATARKLFSQYDIAVEFWLNAAGEVSREGYGYTLGATDQVRFYHPANSPRPVLISTVPAMIFSEAMRDVDLFVGVCSIGNDPSWIDNGSNRVQAFDNYWQRQSEVELTGSSISRRAVLEQIVPRLRIASQCKLNNRFLIVSGKLRKYRIHLGSGNILMEPGNQYLCIVSERRSRTNSDLYLPFEGDTLLSLILSKAFLLADDDKIKDPSILRQLRLN